eukprot:13944778-Ditylum_brightwellii.AAC.1
MPSPKLVSRVISCLHGKRWRMGPFIRLPKQGKNAGINSKHTQESLGEMLTSQMHPNSSSKLSRGTQVKVPSLGEALAVISKTIELAGESSPIYKEADKYNLPLELCME